MKRFIRAARAAVVGSVIAGGIVLGFAGVASAHTVTPSGGAGTCTSPLNSTWQGTGSIDLALTSDNATVTVTNSPAGTVHLSNPYTSSNSGITHSISVTGIPDSDSSVTVDLHVAWTDEFTANTSFTITEPEGGCTPPPPPPVAPTVHLTATASTTCGDFTVPVTLTVGPGANLVGSNGTVYLEGLTSPNPLVVAPGHSGSGSVVFPASDAGKSEQVGGVYQMTGYEGETPLSVSVTLPAVCTTTVTVPVPGPPVPGPTTTVTVPGPTQVVTVPCFGAVPGGTYGGACPVPTAATPAAPAPAPAPAPAAAKVPVGAPQTGFGGAAISSTDDGSLYLGGGLVLIGLLTAIILFTTRKRSA